MDDPLRRLTTLPLPATMVVLSLALLVPASAFLWWSIRESQLGGSPAFMLTQRYFGTIWLGRSIGAVLLAVLLLCWRRPMSVAVTITAVWLAGPPITFLWKGIVVLASSAGQFSWAGSTLGWLGPAALFPGLVTADLIVPRDVRRAFEIF